jgi:hypothetical protein
VRPERDFILRMIQQLALLLARVLRLKLENQLEAAERLLVEGYGSLFGVDPKFFALMDAKTAAAALGHSRKVTAFAQLLGEQADLARRKGEPARARELAQRALALLDASAPMSDEVDERAALSAQLRAF